MVAVYGILALPVAIGVICLFVALYSVMLKHQLPTGSRPVGLGRLKLIVD